MDRIMTLRGWIAVVAAMAFGNTIQCFVGTDVLTSRLYNGKPELVTGLAARLFGVWTVLAGVLRLYCAWDIRNKTLYVVTIWSYVIVLGHFLSEVFVFKSSLLEVGVIVPLIISGVTLLWMLVEYRTLDFSGSANEASSKHKSLGKWH